MTKLYDKDDCAPDALSAIDWINQNGYKVVAVAILDVDDADYFFHLCVTSKLEYLLITYDCGIYESVHLIDQEHASKNVTHPYHTVRWRQPADLGYNS